MEPTVGPHRIQGSQNKKKCHMMLKNVKKDGTKGPATCLAAADKAQTRSEKGWQIIANSWDFNGGPVANTPHPQRRGPWGAISGQGTRYYMSQLGSHAATKDPACHNQDSSSCRINKYIFKLVFTLASEEQ